MRDFKINHTDTQEKSKYASKNPFIGKQAENEELPKYQEIKDKLPKPFWAKHDDYIA